MRVKVQKEVDARKKLETANLEADRLSAEADINCQQDEQMLTINNVSETDVQVDMEQEDLKRKE